MLVFLGLVSHDLFFPHVAIKKRKKLPLEKGRKKKKIGTLTALSTFTTTTTTCFTAVPKDFPPTDNSCN